MFKRFEKLFILIINLSMQNIICKLEDQNKYLFKYFILANFTAPYYNTIQ